MTHSPLPGRARALRLEPTCARVRAALATAGSSLAQDGLPVPPLEGKLLRPLMAFAAVPAHLRPAEGHAFWYGALAVQMVHEASLLHDDIIDGATRRRDRDTELGSGGVARALVEGDHLLTAAYRAALRVGSPAFTEAFTAAVERTVAGEIAQNRAAGRALPPPEYRAAIEGKSGELFGAAFVLAADLAGSDPAAAAAVGRRVGALYQMIDDVLDYCAALPQGKPPLQDLRQKKWSFVLDEAGLGGFGVDERDVLAAIFDDGGACGERLLQRIEAEVHGILALLPQDDGLVGEVLDSWVAMAREGVETEWRARHTGRGSGMSARASVQSPSAADEVAAAARAVGPPAAWSAYFGRHSKTFRFASLLFPAPARRSVAGVYAFCRFTDDLVDEAQVPADEARARVEAWRAIVHAAYEGEVTGIPLADHVIGEMRERGVPRHYADDLLTGVAMDLEPVRFKSMAELEVYTYRVASVVGGWVTELFGVHQPDVLQRAFDMGHAMQLTNIVRDVGEDWRRGRIYLPADLMQRFGIDEHDVARVASGARPLPEGWVALTEALMTVADRHYDEAFHAVPDLPLWYGRPVAVAARVYQAIHGAVRANGHDNGTRRAWTRLGTKLRVATGALIELRRLRLARGRTPALRLEALEG